MYLYFSPEVILTDYYILYWVRFLYQEDLLEKEMATHSNILA